MSTILEEQKYIHYNQCKPASIPYGLHSSMCFSRKTWKHLLHENIRMEPHTLLVSNPS